MRMSGILVALLCCFVHCAALVHATDVPNPPTWVKVLLDAGMNRAVDVTWEHTDGVLYWDVARNCSRNDTAVGATAIIRVTEARLVDHRRDLNELCSYRVAACNLDGCSAQSSPQSAKMGETREPNIASLLAALSLAGGDSLLAAVCAGVRNHHLQACD
jgi:hypothetical protein